MSELFQAVWEPLCFGAVAFFWVCFWVWCSGNSVRHELEAEHARKVDQLIVDIDRVLAPQPDPTQDKTGAVAGWDCMTKGHVCAMGSAYCLQCRTLIG